MREVVIVGTEANASEATTDTVSAATAETLAEASTEVAQIDANRSIAIAEINAETERAAIEASRDINAANAAEQSELQQCRQSIETLGNQVATLAETVLSIQTRLEASPPNPSPSGEAEDPEKTEAPPKPEQARKKKALRWI